MVRRLRVGAMNLYITLTTASCLLLAISPGFCLEHTVLSVFPWLVFLSRYILAHRHMQTGSSQI